MCAIVGMKRTSGDSALTIYSIILEHSHSDALNPRNLLHLYLILTPWLLGMIVITNCYKGIVTTHLTLPLKVDLFKDFGQLANRSFTVFVRPFVTDLDMYEMFSQQTGKWEESSIFVNYIHEQNGNITYSRFQEVKNAFKLVDKNSFANESYINSILNCSKSAIADWSDTIEQEYHQLLTKVTTIGKFIARGEESLWNSSVGWALKEVNDPNFRPRIKRIAESGILHFWSFFDAFVRRLQIPTNTPQPSQLLKEIAMEDKIRVVFLLYLICLVFALISFLREVIGRYFLITAAWFRFWIRFI